MYARPHCNVILWMVGHFTMEPDSWHSKKKSCKIQCKDMIVVKVTVKRYKAWPRFSRVQFIFWLGRFVAGFPVIYHWNWTDSSWYTCMARKNNTLCLEPSDEERELSNLSLCLKTDVNELTLTLVSYTPCRKFSQFCHVWWNQWSFRMCTGITLMLAIHLLIHNNKD